jgi:hypothetical protein
MEKLTKAFRRADSNDILTYSLAGTMVLMIIGLFAMGIASEPTSQTSESSAPHQNLTLGR